MKWITTVHEALQIAIKFKTTEKCEQQRLIVYRGTTFHNMEIDNIFFTIFLGMIDQQEVISFNFILRDQWIIIFRNCAVKQLEKKCKQQTDHYVDFFYNVFS